MRHRLRVLTLSFLALIVGRPEPAVAQSNDNFAGRLKLSGAATTAVSNNLRATYEAGEPNHADHAAGRSLWWTWTAPTSGVVNFSTFSGSSGVAPPRVLAVYTGGALPSLTEVGSSNDLQLHYLQEFTQPASLAATGASVNATVTAGTTYQIAVDAAAGSTEVDDGTVVLSINTPPTVVSAAGVNAATGAVFQYNILASNGPTAYGASNLPPGLSLNPATGQISGVLSTNGTYPIALSATGPGGTGTATLTVQAGDPAPAVVLPPVINGYAGAGGYVGASFTYYFEATYNPTSYAATNLPPGLTLDGVNGEITGTPTSAGTFAVPVTATNAAGTGSATVTISVTAAPLPPVLDSNLAASGTVGYSFFYYIETYTEGASAPVTGYAASGLPPGLSLSSSDEITGTPTQAGVYPVAVSATNTGGTRTATVTITVSPAPGPVVPASAPPQLDSSAATTATVGSTFSYALDATNAPTSFGASSLPPGLSVDPGSGAITGTPTAAGVFRVPVSAANAYGTSTATLTINVFASVAARTTANGTDLPVITSAASASGYTGQAFGYALTASYNGEPSYYYPSQGAWTYAATGLPPGLTLSVPSYYYGGGDATINGTPTTTGTYQTTVSATFSNSPYYPVSTPVTTTAVVTFFIKAGPVVTVPTFTSSASLSAVVGTAISSYPAATGSPTSYAANGLPPGLACNASSGYITGTPTTAGTYQTTLTATNSAGTGSAVITYIVTPPTAPLITSAATAYSGVVGTAFTYTVAASPAATSFAAGNLPPGLSFNASAGVISGTPTTAGVYPVPLAATNAVGTGNATLTITVAATAAPTAAPIITGYVEARGTVGTSFYYYDEATNSPTGYAAGTLPPGLTLDTYGDIEGTPTTPGTYTVPISATNAGGTGSATLTVVIAPLAAPVLSGSAVVNATVNASISYSINASSSPTSYAATGLPSGVTLNAATGSLSGAVSALGSYPVTLAATNAAGTGSATLTINVVPVPAPALPVITSAAGATGVVGSAFSYTIQASGSPTNYAAGGLPAGWTFNPSTGVISGTPTAAGTYPLTLSATNATGTGSATLTVVVASTVSGPPVVTSAAGPVALLKEPFNYLVTTSPAATSYSVSSLPAGLSFNATTRQISGTPTSAATSKVPILATNSAGTTQVTLTLPVINPSFAVFTSPAAVSAVVGQTFSTTLTTSGSGGSSNSASPLPAGLSINAATGVISGTPTAAGNTSATISQYTSQGYVSGRLLFTVAAAAPTMPVISSPAGVGAYVGVPFSYALQATNSPTAFATSGLPAGLTLNVGTGVISGTPTSTGTYAVGVSATNAKGTSATATVMINIATLTSAAPVLSAASAAGVVGSPLTYTVATNTASYYLSASSLPPGLTLNSSTGAVSGAPTTAGVYYPTFNVTNSYGASSSTVITFGIAASPTLAPTLTSPAGAGGTVGSAFSYAVAANNGATSLNATGLPTGLSFSVTTGVISGTPAMSGTFSIPLTATNSVGQGSAILTLAVAAAPPVAPTLSTSNALVQSGTLGSPGSFYIYATGNPARYAASNLPPGLSVSAATGNISGTPTTAGTYPVTISASNATGSAGAVVTFVAAPAAAVPAFTSLAAESTGDTGVAFPSINLNASGSPTSYAASGLPPGLSLNATSGAVTGTPTAAGVYPVVVSATNAAGTGSAVWTVVLYDSAGLQPVLSSASAEVAAVVGQAFSGSFQATVGGGSSSVSVPLTLSYSGLPPGISGDSSITTYAYFSGTPTAVGTYPVTINATAPNGVSASEVVTFVITSAPPAVTSAAGVAGNVGSALAYALSSASTVSAYAASGLPPGLALNTSTGAITGTPTTAGNYAVSVSAVGVAGTGSATITFQIAAPAFGGLPVINSAATANCQDPGPDSYYYPPFYGNAGGAFSYTVTAINLPTSFGASNLPAGLSLNPYTGVITGQPLVSGTFQVPISATNAVGTCNATLTILATASLPTIFAELTFNGSIGTALSYEINTPATEPDEDYYYEEEGGVSDPLTFAAAGLPPGLSINTATGNITGTPTQGGTYPVLLSVTNRAGTGTAVLTVVVAATAPPAIVPPVFEGEAMAAGFVGFPLSYSLFAGYAASYSASGLPAGLSLNPATGNLTGTPTRTGTFSVPVTATNAAGTVQAVLTVAVDAAPPPPVFYGLAESTATVGAPFTYAIDAYSESAVVVTTYGASNVPAGLSLNPQNGLITGTPTGPTGTFLIPVSASSGTSTSTSNATLTLDVQAASISPVPPALATPAGALGFTDNPLGYALGGTGFAPASTLPAGLSLDPATSAITGYPASAGTYQVSLTVPGGGSGGMAVQRSGSRAVKTKHSLKGGKTSATSSSGTAVLTLNVLTPDFSLPRLTGQPTSATVLQNGSVTLAAAAVGAPAPAYQWAHNGVPLAGATSATLALTSVQPSDTGAYTFTATNAAGQVVSLPAALTVQQTYATWQAAHFTTAEINAGLAADGVDLTGDGVPNLLKYALGIDPITGTGGSLAVGTYVAANGALQLAFARDTARTDLNYVVEASPDLKQWTPIAGSTGGSPTANLGGASAIIENGVPGTSQVNVVVAGSQATGTITQQFLRLRVVRP